MKGRVRSTLAPGLCPVTGALRVMGLQQDQQFQNYHHVLNRATWSSHSPPHIGAHFTHGPEPERFEHQRWAGLPKSRAKKQRKTPEQMAAAHGLTVEEVGVMDSERLLAFVWRIGGRPEGAVGGGRERDLKVVLDNYSVHKSEVVERARPGLMSAGIELVYLPSCSPNCHGSNRIGTTSSSSIRRGGATRR